MEANLSSKVTGIILAGGTSSRLGENKALIDVEGMPLVERVNRRLHSVVDKVILVTNTPELFGFLNLPMVGDIYTGLGTLGGVHAGLHAIQDPYGLVVGCDMPFLNPALLRYLIESSVGYDVVMPRINDHHEPLHALYARRCLPTIERGIAAGERRVLLALAGLNIRYIPEVEIVSHDPDRLSFFNINTPEELAYARALLSAG